jgi:3-methyl-2-oxobutanoate hydroxymethyltransferase
MPKKNIIDIISAKSKRKIVCTTAYTFPMAKLISELDFDIILIGDSLGMEIQGYTNTIYVTLEDIIYHCRAVVRANTSAYIVADMPFLSTDVSISETIKNAGMLIQKAGADAVKIEGGKNKAETIKALVDAGIPVMGHIGLNPQKILEMGKYSVQGKSGEQEKDVLESAKTLQDAGVFSIVLECVPAQVAKKITEAVSIPTIGIGAGRLCDGQILVSNDIIGMHPEFRPKFVKHFGNAGLVMKEALLKYKTEVENGSFPDAEHSY